MKYTVTISLLVPEAKSICSLGFINNGISVLRVFSNGKVLKNCVEDDEETIGSMYFAIVETNISSASELCKIIKTFDMKHFGISVFNQNDKSFEVVPGNIERDTDVLSE